MSNYDVNENKDAANNSKAKKVIKSCGLKRVIILTVLTSFFGISAFGAYLRNVPQTITQPDGTKINCFATGDEFYNWLHDSAGYTIIQDKITGYYCYAILAGDDLVASQYVVGTVSPSTVNLTPYTNISGEKIMEKVNEFWRDVPQREEGSQTRGGTIAGTINNIVIYIRFADQDTFPLQQAIYTAMFNDTSSGANSMRNYFREATYGNLDIISHFYPINDGVNILSYQDIHPRNYYLPYDTVTNPIGYSSSEQGYYRLSVSFRNAVDYVKNQIPTSLNIDYNNDGKVDNICFIIQGASGPSETNIGNVLWPHRRVISCSVTIVDTCITYINGKKAHNYNLQIESILSYSGNGVLCHEIYHSLGALDLYQDGRGINYGDMEPVGPWDNMSGSQNPPPHMGAYMKHKYGKWIPFIPEITTSGTYTLQSLTSPTNNCYKISIKNSSQYIVLEYRKKAGTFESSLPGSGLIIYRINEPRHPAYGGNVGNKGSGGKEDEVYVFRPNGKIDPDTSRGDIRNAHFSKTVGRTAFSNFTNPHSFTAPNGDYANICIKNIRENVNGTLSFEVRLCDYYNITHSNTNNLPNTTTTCGSIQTTGTVTVKSTDNVIFEAENEVILDAGFEIQEGGTFEIYINKDIMNCCED